MRKVFRDWYGNECYLITFVSGRLMNKKDENSALLSNEFLIVNILYKNK